MFSPIAPMRCIISNFMMPSVPSRGSAHMPFATVLSCTNSGRQRVRWARPSTGSIGTRRACHAILHNAACAPGNAKAMPGDMRFTISRRFRTEYAPSGARPSLLLPRQAPLIFLAVLLRCRCCRPKYLDATQPHTMPPFAAELE